LGTSDYARVRCGVDRVPPGWALEKWVLSRFRPQDEDVVGEMIIQARLAIESCQREGISVAMNRFNGANPIDPITD
jgi:PTH1 family peptidyl-tRNA hydrolase